MRTRKIIALSLISAGAAVLFSGCPNQPASPCVVARAAAGILSGNAAGLPYIVQYYLADGGQTGDCTTNPQNAPFATTNGFGGSFVGEVWAEAYGPVTAINKLTGLVPEEFGWTNGYTATYVEGSPFSPVPNPDPTAVDDPVIFGNFTTDTQDVNGTCTIAGTDAGVQYINGVLVTYNFPTTVMYTTPQAGEGTQFVAQVIITRDDGTGSPCVSNYTALGLWPSAVCATNNDCNPFPQPSLDRPLGSGLLPGIPYICSAGLVPQDPIIAPNNVPPTNPDGTPDIIPCATDGMGTDTCAAFADGDAGVGPGGTVCSNQTQTQLPGPVACTVDSSGNDSCDATGGPGGVCLPDASGNTFCNSSTGNCAFPFLDALGCSSGSGTSVGTPYSLEPTGCGGGTKNNNGVTGSNLCFYNNPSPAAFPYSVPYSYAPPN